MTKNEMKERMQEEAREAYATMNAAAKALGYYYTVRGKMNDFCRNEIKCNLFRVLIENDGKISGIQFAWDMMFDGQALVTIKEVEAVSELEYESFMKEVEKAIEA